MKRGEVASSLFERLGQGMFIEPVTDPDWVGLPNNCHENVKAWIALHPRDRTIRGFLVTPLSGGGTIFDLHSVIQREDGSLVDVTSLPYRLRFIRYEFSENEFEENKWHLARMVHPPMMLSDFWAMPAADDGPEF